MEHGVLLLVLAMGILTYMIRVSFFIIRLEYPAEGLLKRGMDAVTPSMLVALVIPFILVPRGQIRIFHVEVYSLAVAALMSRATKRYSLGLFFALGFYLAYPLIHAMVA